jgi:hypothetical protein
MFHLTLSRTPTVDRSNGGSFAMSTISLSTAIANMHKVDPVLTYLVLPASFVAIGVAIP